MRSHMSAEDRRQEWTRVFQNEEALLWCCRPTLLALVEESLAYHEMLFGAEAAAGAAARLLGTPPSGQAPPDPSWREALAHAPPRAWTTWPITQLLWQLGLYGRYGVTLAGIPMAQRSGYIDRLVAAGEAFVAAAPFARLTKVRGEREFGQPVDRVVRMAVNRKRLDDGSGGLHPAALAEFGFLSEGRLRNLMSEGRFEVVQGRITPASARAWLEGRPGFWNSIWREED